MTDDHDEIIRFAAYIDDHDRVHQLEEKARELALAAVRARSALLASVVAAGISLLVAAAAVIAAFVR